MIVDRAGLVNLAIEPFERRCVVVLYIDKRENVADPVEKGQIRAKLTSVTGVARGNLCTFRHEADQKAGAEMIMQLAQSRDQVHEGGRGGMPEIRISRLDRKRRAFEVDIDSVKAILGDNAGDRGDVVRYPLRVGER